MPLVDLDELTTRVRNQLPRDYIREAIAAYNIGALRSAVISTWVALTADLAAKIRELALYGDAAAAETAKKMASIVDQGNPVKIQQIENNLLEEARDSFEFISAAEYYILVRIRQDRNKCAHPALADSPSVFIPNQRAQSRS